MLLHLNPHQKFAADEIFPILLLPLLTETTKWVFLANSEDPDEVPHNWAFHKGLHGLQCQKQSSEKEHNIFGNYNL